VVSLVDLGATLCPACLRELADNYPYDHVAIDRALAGQPELFTAMTHAEQREAVLTGLERGMSITLLAKRLHCRGGYLRELLPADHPESVENARQRRAAERAALDTTIRTLWAEGIPDTDIALRTGHSVYVIADARRRLALSTLPRRQDVLSGGAG
jgi:hypothetical protein